MKLRKKRILKYFVLAFIPELFLVISILAVVLGSIWHHGFRNGIETNKITEAQRQKLLSLSSKAITFASKHEQAVLSLMERVSAVERCQWGNTYAKRIRVKMTEYLSSPIPEYPSVGELRKSFIESLSIILRDSMISDVDLELMNNQLKDLEQTNHLSCSNYLIDPLKRKLEQRTGEYILKISSTLSDR